MATGDILSVVSPTGTNTVDGGILDITIEGFTTGMTWNLGGGTGAKLEVGDTPNITVTVTSEGYNGSGTLGTITRNLVATHVARKEYPNQASEQQSTSGGNATIRVWLNENIYNDDTATITIAAATFTNSGGSSQTSASASAVAITNNSTLDYPTITAAWDRYLTCHADRVKTSFDIGVHAIAGHGIASVKIEVTDQSAHSTSVHVTSSSATQRSASTLYAESYKTTVPLTSFTQGDLLTCNFTVYPKVGDAATVVATSGNTTSVNEAQGRNECVLLCDKNDTLDSSKYVDSVSGNDTTGDGSSGTPYATIGKAVSVSGVNIVYCKAGEYVVASSRTRRTTNEWIVVQPAPGVSTASVVIENQSLLSDYKCQRYQLKSVTIALAASSSGFWGGDAANHIMWKNCVFDSQLNHAAARPSIPLGYGSDSSVILNCTGDISDQYWNLRANGSDRTATSIDGCVFESAQGDNDTRNIYHFVANDTSASGMNLNLTKSGTLNPAMDGVLIGWNFMTNQGSGYECVKLGWDSKNNHNCAIVGNVFEKTSGGNGSLDLASATALTECNNLKVIHNTTASQASSARHFFCYNDTGTTRIDRKSHFYLYNSFGNANIKQDTFSLSGNTTGGWPTLNGVNCRYNYWQTASDDAFRQEYSGLGSTMGTVASPLDPNYVDAATDDYTPDTGSALIGAYTASDSPISFDLYGNPINGDIGAIQTVTSTATSYNLFLLGSG